MVMITAEELFKAKKDEILKFVKQNIPDEYEKFAYFINDTATEKEYFYENLNYKYVVGYTTDDIADRFVRWAHSPCEYGGVLFRYELKDFKVVGAMLDYISYDKFFVFYDDIKTENDYTYVIRIIFSLPNNDIIITTVVPNREISIIRPTYCKNIIEVVSPWQQ